MLGKSNVSLTAPCGTSFLPKRHPFHLLSNGRHSVKPIIMLICHEMGCLKPWEYPLIFEEVVNIFDYDRRNRAWRAWRVAKRLHELRKAMGKEVKSLKSSKDLSMTDFLSKLNEWFDCRIVLGDDISNCDIITYLGWEYNPITSTPFARQSFPTLKNTALYFSLMSGYYPIKIPLSCKHTYRYNMSRKVLELSNSRDGQALILPMSLLFNRINLLNSF
ncbi:hypothetical protein M9H77_30505 [Catharanthus roseus]|uniref:Uncharacterized protein n=1 Tax=Catharanthus roseus TaxID=4058 RepID=A0ACC0A1Q0_CATRO|nr:hypothetical protein M9H77_30505 [Catharanthus roseus]